MKRLARQWLKWSAATATMLLLIAWIGSGWWWWRAMQGIGDSLYEGFVWGGRLDVKCYEPRQAATSLVQDDSTFQTGEPHDQPFRWWFKYEEFAVPPIAVTSISIPLWFLILLTGIPAAWMFRTDRRRRRALREGLCRKCGYDLRGLAPESACPECGWNCG